MNKCSVELPSDSLFFAVKEDYKPVRVDKVSYTGRDFDRDP